MIVSIFRRMRNADWVLFAPMVILMMISLIIIYSVGTYQVSPDPVLFKKQVVFAVLGLIVFFTLSTFNYRTWSIYSKVVYIGSALALIAVLVFGVTIRGTTGWISLGFANIQPVEFVKIGLIIFLAKYFSDHGRLFFLWRHTIISGLATSLVVFLVLMQPDVGSAIVLFGTWFLMLLVVGIPRKHLVMLVSAFLIIGVVSWFFVLQPYQKDRIITFVSPQTDVLDDGYNVRQSIIAVGSGRVFGRGFGLGSQSQLKFLPEPETDFIFAVIAEEFGFIGTLIVFTGLILFLLRLIVISNQTSDNYAAYFCLGFASLLAVQIFINIGMNIGIAPVTGIPLPFISAGGSSLISLCIAAGLASSIISDQRTLVRGER